MPLQIDPGVCLGDLGIRPGLVSDLGDVPPAPDGVERGIGYDPVQPRRYGRFALKALGAKERLETPVLYGVVGVLAGDPGSDGHEPWVVTLAEDPECLSVPL